jgi:hypothetical protein
MKPSLVNDVIERRELDAEGLTMENEKSAQGLSLGLERTTCRDGARA